MDDYHLQIRRGSELMGRWYLADVEVVRDIAERFTLFLDDDEMEFLADDALVFAYEGVTRMQQGWMKAQKKKRRHRRAAAEAARRKDEAPDEAEATTSVEEQRRQPTRAAAKAPSSELAKKLAAIAAAEDAESSISPAERTMLVEFGREKPAHAPQPAIEVDWSAAREEMAIGRDDLSSPIEPAQAGGRLKRRESERREPADTAPSSELWVEVEPAALQPEPEMPAPIYEVPEPQAPEPHWPEQWPEVSESVPWAEPTWVTPTEVRDTTEEAQEEWGEPSWMAPDEQSTQVAPAESTKVESDLRRRFEALERATRGDTPTDARTEPKARKRRTKAEKSEKAELITPGGVDGHVPFDAASPPEAQPLRPRAVKPKPPEKSVEKAASKSGENRNEGHHPIESSVGLLAKLRRAPKMPDGHVHVYQESGSGVGLTRRVCVECSHVSISSDE